MLNLFGFRIFTGSAPRLGLELLGNQLKTAVNNSAKEINVIQTRSIKQDYHSRGLFTTENSPRGHQYKPKVMKRIQTHGLLARLETRGGKQILWRKILRGPKGWITMVPGP